MKRFWIAWLLCLMPLFVLGEEATPPAAEKTGKPLYAVRGENGLYGYIDCLGDWVISPRFSIAEDFRGDYACVSIYSDEFDASGTSGIIDCQGNWVLTPEYDVLSWDSTGAYIGGRDEGFFVVSGSGKEGKRYGFFDIPSGFFSDLRYEAVRYQQRYENLSFHHQELDGLIPVVQEGLGGYADRTSGEIAIPCRYDPDRMGNFTHGVAR